ncbi:MAG: AI-2E family transporter [Brumimicrobium sp.]|nr:AI-2E family transporter [Brumimicrobium sp.]
MEKTKLKRINQVLLFCFMIIAGMYFGAPFLIPFTFAVFFTTLVLPLSNLLEKKLKLGRITTSFISTLVLLLVVGGLFFVLFRQLTVFMNDLLAKKNEILGFVDKVQQQIVESTGVTLEQQEAMFKERLSGLLEELQAYISGVLSDFTDILLSFLLMLIYVFFLLINRDKFADFLMKYVPEKKKKETEKILAKVKTVANRYLWGRVQVMLVLAVMYTITFLAYDLEYSALLIVFGVLITVIPYVGPFLSGIFPVIFMMIFSNSTTEIVSFAIIVLIIQLIESYVLEPVIIGSEVQQSPLFVIIAIVLGGMIWGFAGLILFVPIFGVLKIIFDYTPGLKPAGFLIGYERKGSSESIFEKWRRKIRGISED